MIRLSAFCGGAVVARVLEYREIPLDQLEIGQSQARLQQIGQSIPELADSIRQQGLLQPILVAPIAQQGRYEILLGQRRFLAHQLLAQQGHLSDPPTIMAAVLDERVEAAEAKAISLTENLLREGLTHRDTIDACTFLYNHYGSVRLVAEATGISESKVRTFVKYTRLVEPLKRAVDNGEADLDAALKAQDISLRDKGGFDSEEAVQLAKEMSGMSGAQQKKLQARAIEAPEMNVNELIEDAKTGSKITQIVVTLTGQLHVLLQKYAQDQGTSQDVAASTLLETALAQLGYPMQ